MPNIGLSFVVAVGLAVVAWYVYQIGSRKQGWLAYKMRRVIVCLLVYGLAALMLLKQGLPSLEAILVSALAGLGCGWLFVSPPRQNRRISKAVRREVIARDLTSKGLRWDAGRYHIDHVVPFSRGGDNSVRNLRVIEKGRNLRKGAKMPGFGDFLKS